MTRIGDKIAQGIGGGIGLAQEAYANHKAGKKKATSPSDAGESSTSGVAQQSPELTEQIEVDVDAQEWQLDEAADSVTYAAPPKGNWTGPEGINKLAEAFLAAHPPPNTPPSPTNQLPLPVIIPQRRPTERRRGFVRGYSPLLEDQGIDQDTFMNFLDFFDEAVKISPIIEAVNVASAVTGFIPTVTTQAISISTQVIYRFGRGTYTRNRTNNFLAQVNKDFFQPRGLFCLILTYIPDDNSATSEIDIGAAIEKRINEQNAPTSGIKSYFSNLHDADATTKGEFQMPEAAPLIYPALDNASEDQKKSWSAFYHDYADRRAQAKYAVRYGDNALTTDTEFKSKWADPKNIQTKQDLKAMLTGGYSRYLPSAYVAGKIADRRNHALEKKNKYVGDKSIITKVKRRVRQKILYLMIVNMPSDEELREATQLLQAHHVLPTYDQAAQEVPPPRY